MRHAASPRIVISGIGVVSPFGVGRERFWDCVSRGCSGTRAITEFDASELACRVAAPVTGVTIDDVPVLENDDTMDAGYHADPKRYSRSALIGVIAAREAWADAGQRIGEPTPASSSAAAAAASTSASGMHDFFVEHGKKVSHARSRVDCRHGVERISILAAPARRQPCALVRLHGSTDALGHAARLLRGRSRRRLVRAGRTPATPGMLFAFRGCGRSPRRQRSASRGVAAVRKRRDGFVSARARG